MSSIASTSRLTLRQSILVGSLIFGLFFGAGNLIFPAELGLLAGSSAPAATLGFLLTAVGLPVVGVVAAALSRADSLLEMADGWGRTAAIVFTTVLYLTIGPFFAIPRTATVSFEVAAGAAFDPAAGRWALLVFSLAFFGVVLALSLRPGRLLDYIGRVLTPLFLVLVAALLIASVLAPPTTGPLPAATDRYATAPVVTGLLDGYNTMDALASLAFALVIVEAVRRMGVTAPARVGVEIARGGIVALLAMSVVYAGLAQLGATSVDLLPRDANGARVLAVVSGHHYGDPGYLLVAATMFVACLKTAVGLVVACSEMFARMFPRALGQRPWAVVITAVACALANVGLDLIVAAAVPVLRFLYPLAIVLIVLGLGYRFVERRPLVTPVVGAVTALVSLLDVVQVLGVDVPGLSAVVAGAARVLPGFALGFGWVLPALAAGVVAVLLPTHRRAARRTVAD